MERFKGYSTLYFLISGINCISLFLQYRDLKLRSRERVASIRGIHPAPLIILTAWSLASFGFHLIMIFGFLYKEFLI